MTIKEMWKNYLKSIGENEENTEKSYGFWCFGTTEDDANNLINLVLKGEKKATASLYSWYETGDYNLPHLGQLSIITDYNGIAKCIIETKKVSILPFYNVDEDFAYKEGEGDKSLDYWRSTHRDFFTKELKKKGIEFTDDMLVICEEFEVIYK